MNIKKKILFTCFSFSRLLVSAQCPLEVSHGISSNYAEEALPVVSIGVPNAIASDCTGTLITSYLGDKAYILTARHCTNNFNTIRYWNGEYEGYAEVVWRSNTTDVALCRVLDFNYEYYFAGWSFNDVTPTSGFGFHYSDGLVQQFVTSSHIKLSKTYSVTKKGRRKYYPAWLSYYSKGCIKGGGSGSPFFNQNRRIVGVLSTAAIQEEDDNGWNYSASYARLADCKVELRPFIDPFYLDIEMLDKQYLNPKSVDAITIEDKRGCASIEGIGYGQAEYYYETFLPFSFAFDPLVGGIIGDINESNGFIKLEVFEYDDNQPNNQGTHLIYGTRLTKSSDEFKEEAWDISEYEWWDISYWFPTNTKSTDIKKRMIRKHVSKSVFENQKDGKTLYTLKQGLQVVLKLTVHEARCLAIKVPVLEPLNALKTFDPNNFNIENILHCMNGVENSNGRIANNKNKNIFGDNIGESIDLKVYPNPYQTYFEIEFSLSEPQKVKVSLLNLNGSKLDEIEYTVGHGKQVVQYKNENLPAGVYILEVAHSGQVNRQKLIKHN